MGGADWIGLAISLAVVVITGGIALIGTLLTLVVSGAVVYFVFKRVSEGGAVVISSPLLDAMQASGAARAVPAPADDRGDYIKRCSCRVCSAPKTTPSTHAYVYCESCGELVDFDFQAAVKDKRSKLPGPAYEALVRKHTPALESAKAAGDIERYRGLQELIYDAYCAHCPAALSPRVGDPQYRQRFVAYSAAAQTLTDLTPATAATFQAQQAAVGALKWNRANPMSPRVTGDSFWPLIDAVKAHQAGSLDLIESNGLLERHPDRPTREIMRRIGTSLLVQGWMPNLERADAERLLDETGMRDEYVHVEPPQLHTGACPACSAPVEVVAGARRVVCYTCGHMVGVGAGELRCHGCATPMVVPEGSTAFSCPSCDVELQMMRWPGRS